MEKTFTYYFSEKFYYKVCRDDLVEALADCLYDAYYREKSELCDMADFPYVVIRGLKNLMDELDLVDELSDKFESELKEYFRDNAYEEYKKGG